MVTTKADESGIELVFSIPICWEDHQLDNIPLGRGRCLCDDMESTSSMDEVVVELGQCPEVCTVESEGPGIVQYAADNPGRVRAVGTGTGSKPKEEEGDMRGFALSN